MERLGLTQPAKYNQAYPIQMENQQFFLQRKDDSPENELLYDVYEKTQKGYKKFRGVCQICWRVGETTRIPVAKEKKSNYEHFIRILSRIDKLLINEEEKFESIDLD